MAHYRQYATRWLVLFVTFAVSCILWTLAAPLTPSATTAASFYGVSRAALVWSSAAFPAAALLGALPCMLLLDFVNFRVAQVICTVLLLLGTGVRACSNSTEGTEAFVLVIVGQAIAGLGAPILQASTTVIAASWFDDAIRGLANTLMCLSIPIGLYASALIHGLLEIDAPEDRASRVETLHYIHLGLAGLAALLSPALLLAPPRRPCYTAAPQDNCNTPATESMATGPDSAILTPSCAHASPNPRQAVPFSHPRSFNALIGMQVREPHTANNSLRRSRKADDPVLSERSFGQASRLLMQPVFLVMLVAFMLTFSACLVLVIFMFEFVGPYGVGFAKLAGGACAVVFTAGFVGALLDRTQAYRLIMAISQTVVVGLYIWFLIFIPDSDDMILPQAAVVAISVIGFLAIPNSLELCAELSYPQTGIVAGILLWSACQGAVVALVALILYPLLEEGAATPHFDRGRWLVLACLVAGLCLWWMFFFLPIRHLRQAAEKLYKDTQDKRLARARAEKRRIQRNPSRSSMSRQSSQSSIAPTSVDGDHHQGSVVVPMPPSDPDHDLYMITEESRMHTMTATSNSDIMHTRSDREDTRRRGSGTGEMDSFASADHSDLPGSSKRMEPAMPAKVDVERDAAEMAELGPALDQSDPSLSMSLELMMPSSTLRALSERQRQGGANTSGERAAAVTAAARRSSRLKSLHHNASQETAFYSASSQVGNAFSDTSTEAVALTASGRLHASASRGVASHSVPDGALLDVSTSIPNPNVNDTGEHRMPERPYNSGPISGESAHEPSAHVLGNDDRALSGMTDGSVDVLEEGEADAASTDSDGVWWQNPFAQR